MNKFMAWAKANVAIVASIAVIVIVLPAAWFGSSWWNDRIRSAREQAVTKANSDLDQVKVSYQIASAYPNGASVMLPPDAPNPALTQFFKENREKLDAQIGEVVKAAQEINQGDHKPLVDGLFPNSTDKLLALTFIETIAGKGAEKPSAYADLLQKINAGGPADPVALADLLNEEKTQTIAKIQQEKNTDKMSADDDAAIAKTLGLVRLSEYKRHAKAISVYATMEAFPQAPRTIPPEPPDIIQCWQWQFDYWVISDVLKAIDAANRPDGKKTGGVESSIVKRLDRITVEPMALPVAGQTPMPGAAGPATLTGRKSGGAGGAYDLRDVEVLLVVESARIPDLLNAISRTNFMTVTSLEFSDLNPWDELEQGYFYGNSHVVRARMHLETVWLRTWTTPLTPDAVKDAMKAAEAPPEPPPPPPPPPPQPAGEKNKPKGKPPAKRPGPKGRGGAGPD